MKKVDWMKSAVKIKYYRLLFAIIGLVNVLPQAFAWTFIDYFSITPFLAELGKFCIYTLLLLFSFFFNKLSNFRIETLRIISILLIVERIIAYAYYREYLNLSFTIIHWLTGLILLIITFDKDLNEKETGHNKNNRCTT